MSSIDFSTPSETAPLLAKAKSEVVNSALVPQSAEQSKELQLLTEAAVKFEAFFVAQMMKQMRQATAVLADPDSPLRDEANQAPLAMADHAVADNLAGQRAFGIADVLVRQMGSQLGVADTLAQTPQPYTTRAL